MHICTGNEEVKGGVMVVVITSLGNKIKMFYYWFIIGCVRVGFSSRFSLLDVQVVMDRFSTITTKTWNILIQTKSSVVRDYHWIRWLNSWTELVINHTTQKLVPRCIKCICSKLATNSALHPFCSWWQSNSYMERGACLSSFLQTVSVSRILWAVMASFTNVQSD